jgi:hypothetical protein
MIMKTRAPLEQNIFPDDANIPHVDNCEQVNRGLLCCDVMVTNTSVERIAFVFTASQHRRPRSASSPPTQPQISGITVEFGVTSPDEYVDHTTLTPK